MSGLTEELHDEAAERYARAAFDVALETSGVDALAQDLRVLDAAFRESADFREVARSPLIDPEDRTRALVAVAERIGVSDLGRKVLGVLASNGRAKELPQVAKAYLSLLARYRGLKQVEIITAAPLSADERADLIAALKAALGADVEATDRIDPSLIGGFVVRAGSRQYDASVRAKLDALALALTNAR